MFSSTITFPSGGVYTLPLPPAGTYPILTRVSRIDTDPISYLFGNAITNPLYAFNSTSVSDDYSVPLTEGIDYTFNPLTRALSPINNAFAQGSILSIVGFYQPNSNALPPIAEIPVSSRPVNDIIGTATLKILDINRVKDTDAFGTLYVAVEGDENWIGGTIYISRDSGASYDPIASNTLSSITGTVINAIPAGDITTDLDLDTKITVTGVKQQLSSVTQQKFDAELGLVFVVGDEIIMAKNAILTDSETYELSYLRRGYRQTEQKRGTHQNNEPFTLLSERITKIRLQPTDIGKTLRLKAVSVNGLEVTVNTFTEFIYSGKSLFAITGFSPAQGDVSDVITIYGNAFTDAVSAAIGGRELLEFAVVNDQTIVGVIDSQTLTGKVSVTNSFGTAVSETDFTLVNFGLSGSNVGSLRYTKILTDFTIPAVGETISIRVEIPDIFAPQVPVTIFDRSKTENNYAQLFVVNVTDTNLVTLIRDNNGLVTQSFFDSNNSYMQAIIEPTTGIYGGGSRSGLQSSDIGVTVQPYDEDTVIDSNYQSTEENFTTVLKNKLDGIATGAEVNVQTDWDATSGDAVILNKPDLSEFLTKNNIRNLGRPPVALLQDVTILEASYFVDVEDPSVFPVNTPVMIFDVSKTVNNFAQGLSAGIFNGNTLIITRRNSDLVKQTFFDKDNSYMVAIVEPESGVLGGAATHSHTHNVTVTFTLSSGEVVTGTFATTAIN